MRFLKNKNLLCIAVLSAFLSSGAHSFELSLEKVAKEDSTMLGVWEDPVVLGGIEIYPQKDLFKMDDFAYVDHEIKLKSTEKYGVWNENLGGKYPIPNKLRVSSGKAPVSTHDNEYVRICRFSLSSNKYYEMSATQANHLQSNHPSSFDPKKLCILGGDTQSYWLERYKTFYDFYGNKRGAR